MTSYLIEKALALVFVGMVLVVGLGVVFVGGASAAQPQGGNTTAGNATGETIQIDQHTTVLDSSYDDDTGIATVTVRSETLQRITLTDGGALLEGGEIAQNTVTVEPSDTVDIQVQATQVRDQVAVSIATDQTLYGLPIEVPNSLFDRDSTWSVTRVAGFGAGGGVLLALAIEILRRRFGGRNEVSRVA